MFDVFSFYNVYYPGDFLMWRSTAPLVTAEVNLFSGIRNASMRFVGC